MWRVRYYTTESGRRPVYDLVKGSQRPARAKLLKITSLLENIGPAAGMPYVRWLGGGLYEIRVRDRQELRVFYGFVGKETIVLLHGFIKKTFTIPAKELNIARRRLKEIGLDQNIE